MDPNKQNDRDLNGIRGCAGCSADGSELEQAKQTFPQTYLSSNHSFQGKPRALCCMPGRVKARK